MQERSRQRLEDILTVAARLVDEIGPDEVTTTRIAEELGSSVGSIYAYFHDRSAIFDAIVARSIAEHDRLVAELRDRDPGGDWFGVSFAIIDCLAEIYRTEPGFRSIWFSKHLSTGMIDAMRRMDEAQAHQGLGRLADDGLFLDCPSPIDTMRMYVGLIDKGLDLAFRTDPDGSPTMIEETKQVVRHYIGPYLKAAPGLRGRR
jgi:AcrR family transcriptional regulator